MQHAYYVAYQPVSGTLKMRERKMRDCKMWHQNASVENARLANAREGKVWNCKYRMYIVYRPTRDTCSVDVYRLYRVFQKNGTPVLILR